MKKFLFTLMPLTLVVLLIYSYGFAIPPGITHNGVLTTEIDTLAELESVSNGGAYMSDMLAATSEANLKSIINAEAGTDFQAYDADLLAIAGLTSAANAIPYFTGSGTAGVISSSANVVTLLGSATYAAARTLLDLESGTDFYTIAASNSAHEAELNNSAGLLAALSDETGTGLSVFNTAPTFVTSITIGSAGISETELEIIDGATLTTTQLNYLASATGTTGTATTNLVFSESPTLTGTPALGAATATSITIDASATPGWVFRDSGNPGTDKEIAKIYANFLSGGDGAEDGSVFIQAMLAGSEATVFSWDSDTEQITLGDSGAGEDLILDFEETTDNEVGMSSNSGLTTFNFGSIGVKAPMEVTGAEASKTVATADLNTVRISSAAGDWDLPADSCDAATGNWLTVVANAAHVASITSLDTSDNFYLTDGTAIGANEEVDTDGTAWSSCTVLCVATNTWLVIGERGTCADGGGS